MSIEKPKSPHVAILPHWEQSEARPKPSRKTFTLHLTRFRTLANYITRPTTEAGIVSPACQHRIRLIRSKKAPTEFLKVDEGAMRGLHVPLSCVHHPPRYKEGYPHRNAHTNRTSYPCLGSCSSLCPIMPVVRAAAYLYELSSRRLKWSEPYPRSPLSPHRTPPATTRRWRFHCLYPGPLVSTTYTCDELSRALLLPSHNDSVSLDNERSIDRPVISGLSPWVILMGEGRRWKSGRWVSDLTIITDLGLLLFFYIRWIDIFF